MKRLLEIIKILKDEKNLDNIKKIVKSVHNFNYEKYNPEDYPSFPMRIRTCQETLSSKLRGHKIKIIWGWPEKFEEGEGLKDEYLSRIDYTKNDMDFPETYSVKGLYDFTVIHIASIAKEKYLAQKEKNIEGAVK